MNKKPVYYIQADSKWANIPYTIDKEFLTETIGKSGCGPTCMAMVMATLFSPAITPVTMAALAIKLKDRTENNGTEWEYFRHVVDYFRGACTLKFGQTDKTSIALKELQSGSYVICSMGRISKDIPGHFTKSGHFILAWDYDGKKIKVLDPASKIRSMQTWDVNIFRVECKQYFYFRKG